MQVNETDLEQLELYLDHELADGDVHRLDERLATESPLAGMLEKLRGQRSMRLAAMSTAFDSDAASVERLIASVRIAQVNESMQRRRFLFAPQMRSAFAAAACVAFGLLLGVTLQNRHGSGGVVATPDNSSTGAFMSTGMSRDMHLKAHGAYVVSVLDGNGRELMKVRFPTQEQAQQYIDHINKPKAGAPPVQVGDAKILDEPY